MVEVTQATAGGALAEAKGSNEVWSVEQNGINLIPEAERPVSKRSPQARLIHGATKVPPQRNVSGLST